MSEELVQRLKQGDATAVADYLQAIRRQLLAFIERQMSDKLRSKVDPEDVLQEVSAEAVRTFAAVDLSRWEPFSWLCQLAQRRIIDAHRHYFDAQKRGAAREVPLQSGEGSQRADLVNLLAASLTTPSRAFSRNAREAQLWDAWSQLPDDQREALRLRYVENLPSKEIADRLGKSDAAVRVMLTRSLKRLQLLLGE